MSWIAEQGFSVKIKLKLNHINNISVSLWEKGIDCDSPHDRLTWYSQVDSGSDE